MKAKNQQQQHQLYSSEIDAKEKLIVYVYEYLVHSNAKDAADLFKNTIGYAKEIKISPETPGFLMDWWCVFWDLYCAAPERRNGPIESSPDARAFHDYMRSTPMSPSITSPPQQQHQQQGPPPPHFMPGGGGPRYGPPRPPPRMQGPPVPRYTHSGPPPPQHMNQGPMFVPGPGPDQMGHSPGLNRMTPVGGPPPQQQQPPPQQQQPPPQHINQGPMFVGPGPDQMGHSPGLNRMTPVGGPPPPPQQQQQQPPPQMIVGMQQQQQMGGPPGEPSTPHSQEEYVLPVPFDTNDQCESAEILKLKQSMQEETAKDYEKENPDFLGDYSDGQNKWT